MTAANRTAIFETLPVHQAVCKQIIPAIVSQMIALIYNLADTYFVGMLNDPHQTAAITIAAPSLSCLLQFPICLVWAEPVPLPELWAKNKHCVPSRLHLFPFGVD